MRIDGLKGSKTVQVYIIYLFEYSQTLQAIKQKLAKKDIQYPFLGRHTLYNDN